MDKFQVLEGKKIRKHFSLESCSFENVFSKKSETRNLIPTSSENGQYDYFHLDTAFQKI